MSLISNGMNQLCRFHFSGICIKNVVNYYNPSFYHFRQFTTKSRTNGKSIFKLGLAGITMGALVGTGYSIHSRNKPRQHILNEHTFIPIVQEVPQITSSKSVQYQKDDSGLKLILYQYQTCPFCCKVRAFLDYYGISYDIVEVDPVLRQSIKWSTYKKVPILTVDIAEGYQPLNDSTMIISALSTYMRDNKKELVDIVRCYPFITFIDEDGTKKNEILNKYFVMFNEQTNIMQSKKEMDEERKWRKWTDDVLVHMLSPNVYRTKDEALQAFNWFSEVGEWDKNFPTWERYLIVYVGALAMWMIGKRLKNKYHLKEDVRQSLYDECNYWTRSIQSKGTKFMGGDKPNLADLSVYGVLSSIEGCLTFKDLLENTKITNWYFQMKNAVANHEGAAIS